MATYAPAIVYNGYGVGEIPVGDTIDPTYLPPQGAAAFGSLTGVPGDNTALASALAGKAASVHTHAQSDVTNLITDLAAKAASVHTHAQSDVTGLTAALAGKAASVHTHIPSEVGLANVDNVSDANKPVSTAQAAAIALKTDLAIVQNVAPATGATQTFNITKKNELIALTHAATIAAQTIVFPVDANSQIGQELRLFSRSIVTAITLTLNSNTIYGTALTTIPAFGNAAWRKVAANLWVRIQ